MLFSWHDGSAGTIALSQLQGAQLNWFLSVGRFGLCGLAVLNCLWVCLVHSPAMDWYPDLCPVLLG